LDTILAKKRITVSRNITENDVSFFWNNYYNIISKDREDIWNALLSGLHSYYKALQGFYYIKPITNIYKTALILLDRLESNTHNNLSLCWLK
jgi:hypothetical protein